MENNENPNQGNMNYHNLKTYMHGNFWLKLLVILIVLCAVFKLGVLVGELKGERGFQGHGNMMYLQRGMPYGGMMGNSVYFQKPLDDQSLPTQTTPPSTNPATPAQPAQ